MRYKFVDVWRVYCRIVNERRRSEGDQAGNGFYASGDGAVSTNALLYNPIDIEIDNSDNILIANRYNHKIRRIDAITGIIDTVAGTGSYANPTQCGQATAQNVRAPYGLWIQDNGDFFLTQTPSNNNGANNFSSLRHVTY